jgi:hypothetical protein
MSDRRGAAPRRTGREEADLAARLRAWQATGDPAALWPGTSAAGRHEAHRRLARAAAAVLAGEAPPCELAADSRVSTGEWSAAAYQAGMGALIGYWIERGTLQADDACRRLFAEHLDHGRRRAQRLLAAFTAIHDALRAEGIEPAILKTLHTWSYFPEPGTRPCADIDLLIRPAEVPAARRALREAGFHETRSTSRPWRSEWQPAAPQDLHSLDLDHADNPWSLDLHCALERFYCRGVWARFGDAAFHYRTSHHVAGRKVAVLAQPLLAAFLAVHAGYGMDTVRLVRIVELVLVLRRDAATKALDWEALGTLLRASRTARFAWPALELAERLAPGTVEPAVLRTLARHTTARMRRVTDQVFRAGIHLPRRSLDEKLMWAKGPRELLCNLSELVVPTGTATPLDLARQYVRRVHLWHRGQMSYRAGP